MLVRVLEVVDLVLDEATSGASEAFSLWWLEPFDPNRFLGWTAYYFKRFGLDKVDVGVLQVLVQVEVGARVRDPT